MLRRRARHGHPDRAALVVAGLALILAAGCGGGEESTDDDFAPGVSQPIAKVEFLAEADRICASTNARIEAAADDLVDHRPRPAAG